MLKTNIFIPEKINVGFQNREGTYTGRLAYIIYFDEKGKLRKEASWNSWRNKDIENEIYNNEPTTGFVLNKKAGGYSTGWNHRQTYVRVYDPRGFEFEISVPNLLYILENTNSIKGKGLEGEFVYSYDGKDLVLLPVDSPDYKEIKEFNKVLHSTKSIKVKDLVIGGTYLTKSNEQWIYMGRFDYYVTESKRNEKLRTYEHFDVNKGKHHYFIREKTYSWNKEKYLDMITVKSPSGRFIDTVSNECVDNYAYLMDKLEREPHYSPIDDSKDEYLPYSFEEFNSKFENHGWDVDFYTPTGEFVKVRKEDRGDSKENLKRQKRVEYHRPGYWSGYTDWKYEYEEIGNVEEVFNTYQPHYRRKYLANGKLYKEEK